MKAETFSLNFRIISLLEIFYNILIKSCAFKFSSSERNTVLYLRQLMAYVAEIINHLPIKEQESLKSIFWLVPFQPTKNMLFDTGIDSNVIKESGAC